MEHRIVHCAGQMEASTSVPRRALAWKAITVLHDQNLWEYPIHVKRPASLPWSKKASFEPRACISS